MAKSRKEKAGSAARPTSGRRHRQVAPAEPKEGQPSTPDATSRPVTTIGVDGEGMPTREEIARRAHEIYQARGGGHGFDLDDWLQAERELSGRAKASSETDAA